MFSSHQREDMPQHVSRALVYLVPIPASLLNTRPHALTPGARGRPFSLGASIGNAGRNMRSLLHVSRDGSARSRQTKGGRTSGDAPLRCTKRGAGRPNWSLLEYQNGRFGHIVPLNDTFADTSDRASLGVASDT